MATIRKLTPEEYSEPRKMAMLELRQEEQHEKMINKEGLWRFIDDE